MRRIRSCIWVRPRAGTGLSIKGNTYDNRKRTLCIFYCHKQIIINNRIHASRVFYCHEQKRTCMTVTGSSFVYNLLCHFIASQVQTGNLSGRSILMIYAFAGRLINFGSGMEQSSFCSLFVVCGDCGVYFLNRCFYTGFDRFVAFHSGTVHKNSLFCGFDICQGLHLPLYKYCCSEDVSLKPDTDVLM